MIVSIKRGACDPFFAKGTEQRFLFDDRPAGGIEQKSMWRQCLQFTFPYQSFGGFGEWQGKNQEVQAAGKKVDFFTGAGRHGRAARRRRRPCREPRINIADRLLHGFG